MALDFEAIWQEHQRFIKLVAGGAAVFALLSYVRGGVEANGDALARKNTQTQEKLVEDLAFLEGKEGLEKGRKDGLTRSHEAVLAQLQWESEKGFELPAGEKNFTIVVTDAASRAAEAIVRAADREGVKAPRNAQDLGIDADVREDAARALEQLARADVLKRFILAAIEAGAKRIGPIKSLEARWTEQPPRDGKPAFLRVVPFSIGLECDARTLARILDRFQEKGRFLELVRARATRAKDAGESARLDVELELDQVAIVDAAPTDDKHKGSDDGGRRPTRPRRGER